MAEREEEGIDICALRQRLRDEYAFVNKQKRDLQKEYNNIVSTGDSLLRGLWIAGQQWRNLYRLRGGPKFASECAYTSSLLDSMHFQDGYATVGFKEVKYGNFLRDLRENTEILKSILILADKYNIDTSAFLRTIITSLYGSCLFPADEKSLLMIVKAIIQYQLVYSENPLAIYSTDRNSFVNILDVLCHTSLPCRAFLVLACRDVVFDILLDGSLYWTLEEQELLSVMAIQEVRKKFGEPGSEGTNERIRDHMMRCWVALADAVYALFKKINNSLVCLPDALIWIVSCFYRSSLERGFNDGKARQMVMRFFINQVIAPLLMRPQPFLIDTEVRASRVATFNLKKVTLIIQTLVSIEAGDDISHLSPEARQFYGNLDKTPLHEIVNNLVEQLPKNGDVTLSDKTSMPGIARTSVLITKTDLDSLVDLFCQLKHVASQPHAPNSQRPITQLIDRSSVEKILKNLEGTHWVTANLAKMAFSTQDTDIQHELHNSLQAFNKPLEENGVVLVISLGISTIECPGMLPEEKVLGMPSPKTRRQSTIQEAMANHIKEISESSQLSDSESNESSSEEKLPESERNERPDDVDSADDVLSGFEDSFVIPPPKSHPPKHPPTNSFAPTEDPPLAPTHPPTNPFPTTEDPPLASNHPPANPFGQSVDPFADFDSVAPNVNENDPFTTVITRLPEQPAPIHQAPFIPSEQAPSQNQPSASLNSLTQTPVTPNPLSPSNNQGPLIDLGDTEPSPQLRAPSSLHVVASYDPLFSSGSHSSTESGKRFSSSASSSSDSGAKTLNHAPEKEQNAHSNKKEKKANRNGVGRKSLKENIQNVINSAVTAPNREKKKHKSGTLFHRKARSKKNSERLLDCNDVATFIASVENVKTPKVICDEIMHRYATIMNNRPHKAKSNVAMETTHVSRDEEEIMKDAKNKLRLVLSNGSAPVFPICGSGEKSEKAGRALLTYLKQDLADAITSEDCTMVARLRETLTTLEKLPSTRYPQVLEELHQDYLTRKAYLSYLVRAHQGLIGTRQFLEKALERVDREREICRRYLMTQCVNMFMGTQKEKLDLFVGKFDKLPMADEKSEEMKTFIQKIKGEFERSPLWLGSNDQQKEEAFDAIERHVISQVYWSAVYAFGETDKFRDDVFHESVECLCSTIGEDFSLLEIKEEFQNEAPWFPAQYELYALSAYKTPKDKLKCIQRCCTTIMSLLGMSGGDAVGADAFTPVLIYVVMHANPRGLLTTVDFINNYLTETLTGEQYYCWMQFCSAIQFIKILLEENKSILASSQASK